jgi:hypothetical protein
MIYGEITGNQPPGNMSVRIINDKNIRVPGYPKNRTIEIIFDFPEGITSLGVVYPGRIQKAYLPDTKMGRLILKLL